MSADTPLSRLSQRVGIEPSYWDVYGACHDTSDDTRRLFLAAMGYPADDDAAATASLERIDARPWQRMVEPVTILRSASGETHRVLDPVLLVVLTPDQTELRWFVDLEDGRTLEGQAAVADLATIEQREQNIRVSLSLPHDLPHGYHRVRVSHGAATGQGALIVAPATAYQPAGLNDPSARVWGVACQLYGLRSASNWGMGDFTDLATLCAKTAEQGGDVVGLPPLHTLFPARPELVSPYSPSSRLLLNPLYIDVAAVAEFADCDEAQAMVQAKGFAQRLNAARATDAVAFAEVSKLKFEILEVLFAHFEKTHPPEGSSARRQDFAQFCAQGGEGLHRLALFEALQDHFAPLSVAQWPAPYKGPASTETQAFAAKHHTRVQFQLYLQWQAERQLAAAGTENTMSIGLYRDLAVGVSPDGADAWIDPDAFVDGIRFGAPPDPLGPTGQNWGMPPFNPDYLYEAAYGPYVDMLRANMRHAGALRIDHVMWLQQTFWIPPGGDGRDGAYVRYPLDDLLAILTLESQRNRCVVIGEALGTVPEGFRERLTANGIFSYCLLQFERHPDGLYKRPDAYPVLALATPASHDLPTLAGFWRETDIGVRGDIGLIAQGDIDERRAAHAHDRALLIASLVDQGLLDADFPNTPDLDDAQMTTLIAAIHCFLARSPAALMVMNVEDILASTTQINMPGTVDEYPNWRLKLPCAVDRIYDADGWAEAARRITAERSGTKP